MNRREFNAHLRTLGKRQAWFAEQVQLTYGTVAHWGLPGTPFPSWVELLLAAWIDNQRQGRRSRRCAINSINSLGSQRLPVSRH